MITLTGQPKSTNNIYRYACRGRNPCMYMTDIGVALKEQYQLEARSQWKKEALKGSIKVNLRFFHGDKRKRDIDNYCKILLDSLSGIVYDDDKQIDSLHIEKYYDKEHPRVEVEASTI